MAKAYACDYCGGLIAQAVTGSVTMIVPDMDPHQVIVSIQFNGQGLGEYCPACYADLLGRALDLFKEKEGIR